MEIDIRLYAPLATLFGVTVTSTLWYLNQKRKALGYIVLKQQKLLNIKGELRKNLSLLFNEQKIANAHLVVLRLINIGHLPINPGDYQAHLSINIPPGGKIISANITETVPADLENRFIEDNLKSKLIDKVEISTITLKPVLLNDGDSITVQMLVSELSGKIKISGHINGIRKVTEIIEKPILPAILTQIGALTMAGAMLLVDPRKLFPLELEDLVPYFLIFLLGYVFLSAGLYWPKKSQLL